MESTDTVANISDDEHLLSVLKVRLQDAVLGGDFAMVFDLMPRLCEKSRDIDFLVATAVDIERAHGSDRAEEAFKQALALLPESAVIAIEYAKFLSRAGRASQSEKLGSRAVLLDPQSIPIVCGFIDLLRHHGNIDLALEILSQAFLSIGDHPELQRHLLYILSQNRATGPFLNVSEVAQRLGDAALLDPVRTMIEEMKFSESPRSNEISDRYIAVSGPAAQARGEPDPDRIARRIASGTGDASSFIALCDAPDLTGLDPVERLAAQIGILDIGILFHPGSPLLLAERAKRWRELKSYELGAADASAAHALDPDDVGLFCLNVDFISLTKSTEDALATLEQNIDRYPGSSAVNLKAAQFAYWTGNLSRAKTLLGNDPPDTERAARSELLSHILIAEKEYGQAESEIQKALAIQPTETLHVLNIRVAIALTWPAIPDYVDPLRLARLRTSLNSVDLNRLPHEVLWEALRIFALLSDHPMTFGLLAAALTHPPDSMITLANFKEVVAKALRRPVGDERSGGDARSLSQELNAGGLISQATGNQFWAKIAFEMACALDPSNQAASFNAAFAALSHQDFVSASRHFSGLERVYAEQMQYVSWPSRGQMRWPYTRFGARSAKQERNWPKISVITPSYGQGQFIEETILSVLNQEYPNLQYIVCDGLSEDNTIEVLEKYRDRIDHLIIERDEGQTDAINKGLKLATGELITWINSDDMLAPGALFALAEAYMESNADILYGMCMPHIEYQFVLSNLPAVRQETFTSRHLADIFNYWMKGFFFYQPEVIFSRRILDAIGGSLDDTLYYTMDYDFWMKCAVAGARLQPVSWPIALFRQHKDQKTANLLDCMIEQAEVRQGLFDVGPAPDRIEDLRTRVSSAFDKSGPLKLGLVSSRLGKIFSPSSKQHVERDLLSAGLSVELVDRATDFRNVPDILVKLVHLQNDVEEISDFRKQHPQVPIVGWFWDNHHHLFANYDVAEQLDISVPGHKFASAYLRNFNAAQIESVPLCVTQWSRSEALDYYERLRSIDRKDDLYGGFVRYAFAEKRNKLIEELVAGDNRGVYFLEESDLKRYFGKSQIDRFEDWMSHKVAICLPLRSDLSQRLFDSLLTGQVPIVPSDILDLDDVLPPSLREQLPVVVFDEYSTEAVNAAHKEALRLFDEGGEAAAHRRHLYALKNHSFEARILDLIQVIGEFGSERNSIPDEMPLEKIVRVVRKT